MQTAQGALTRDIGPYFRVAGLIAGSFPAQAGLAIHEAGAKLAGGHLRSQLWYRSRETGHAIDHPDVLSVTRNSNSMDTALLVRDLVPLLEAYDVARSTGDAGKRLRLADAIVQGVSADPELFLTRLDLLPAFTAIEHLFVDGTGYTALGEEQGGLLNRYSDLIRRVAAALVGDAPGFAPGRGTYSPFGLTYGFCADLLSRMALRPLVSQDALHFSLEDVFNHGPSNERPPALSAAGWADLPNWHGHQPIEYSADWADVMFERTMRGLHARAMNPAPNASSVATGRLFVVPETLSTEDLPAGFLPEGIVPAQEHLVTSDVAHALASGATAFPRSQIASDRREGRFLASAELGGRWFGVSKVVLTACIGQGKDALITGAPAPLLDVLRLTCGEIVKLPASGCQPPAPDF
jgi:hypothetical protein